MDLCLFVAMEPDLILKQEASYHFKAWTLLRILVAQLLTQTNAVLQPGGSTVEQVHLDPAQNRMFNHFSAFLIQQNRAICANSVLV